MYSHAVFKKGQAPIGLSRLASTLVLSNEGVNLPRTPTTTPVLNLQELLKTNPPKRMNPEDLSQEK